MTAPRLKPKVDQVERDEPVFYPIEDDEPLAESEYQLFPVTYAHAALTTWFADDPTTWVGSDMFIYYEEGDPGKVVAPDLFVVTQTHKEERRNIFQTWVEGRLPDLVLEILSESNYQNDLGFKFELYQRWGVSEYWLYDPTPTGILIPPLRGYRLVGGIYRPIPVDEMALPGRYRGGSEVLRLELHAAWDWFRLLNPLSGEYLPDYYETQRALAAERQALANERAARAEMERLLREHGIEPPA